MSGAASSVLTRLRQPVRVSGLGRSAGRVGGLPQVSLLPGEVREAGQVAAHRRRMIGVVVLATVVAGVAVLIGQQTQVAAQARLTAAQSRSVLLSASIARFGELRALESRISTGQAGIAVGGSTLIDWQQQLAAIEADMPAGFTVTAITANGATPLLPYEQSTSILEPNRAATVTMTIDAPAVGDDYSAWLRKLRLVPAYADATANTTADATTGGYTVDLTVHLTKQAISGLTTRKDTP